MYFILYVDDEPVLLDTCKRFLEQGGQFSVDITTSASEALDLLKSKFYDAVISDYQMQDMDGIEFLKKIRKTGNIIPFILFTGRAREEVIIQALNEGADFYLQKGGDPKSQFADLAHKLRQSIQKNLAELRIRDLERREADIINFLPDATFVIDIHGVVIAWNHAIEEMTGIPAHDILGKGNYEYAIPFYGKRQPVLIDLIFESDETIKKFYPNMKREGGLLTAESTHARLWGKTATISAKVSALFNSAGRVIGAIESIQDISPEKQT